jgi:tetratricopeptide (TPR) repeat protein
VAAAQRVKPDVMSIIRPIITAAAGIAALMTGFCLAHATDNRALDADVLSLSEEWARAKYLSKDAAESEAEMARLAAKADDLVTKYPGRAEALIWSGIITSERASLTWGVTALRLATRARDTLLEAERLDAKALDAGAPTTLGVLYDRVPAFPIGWGDSDKARQYLEEAVANAPNGREAHYYYAEFLSAQGEYKMAEQLLIRALTLPHHPERLVWDQYLVKMMRELLARVHEKLKS